MEVCCGNRLDLRGLLRVGSPAAKCGQLPCYIVIRHTEDTGIGWGQSGDRGILRLTVWTELLLPGAAGCVSPAVTVAKVPHSVAD